jgi:predicted ribosomally synthesized peptide with nif11-like leader
MSVENVIAFGKRAMDDPELRNELMAAVKDKSPDEAATAAAAVATRHGCQVTPAEVKQGYQTYLQMSTPAGGELSDAQLEAVAGGSGPGNKAVAPKFDQKQLLHVGK